MGAKTWNLDGLARDARSRSERAGTAGGGRLRKRPALLASAAPRVVPIEPPAVCVVCDLVVRPDGSCGLGHAQVGPEPGDRE